jgi:rhomboid protease GluP
MTTAISGLIEATMSNPERRSILCPHCNRLISLDEQSCPYCGLSNPGSWWKNNVLTRVYLKQDNIIKTIITVNVALFAISILLSSSAMGLSMNPFTFLSPSSKVLLLLGGTGVIPVNQFHRWWTLISASYLHGGILHIFFNMAALSQIGPLVLQEYGLNRMIILYTVGGAIGFWISCLAGVPFTIGASASICALIGSILYYGKSRGGLYGQTIFKQILGWVIGLFIFGLLVPGINNWGHGGGIGAGILLGFLLGYQEVKKEHYFHKMLAGVCILSTILILIWAIIATFYYRFVL